MKLLIVEDNELMRHLIKSMVQDLVATIDECSNGEEAVAVYAEKNPDCVLMDIEMAGMDGLTATERIIAAHPEARIVIVTQYRDKYLRQAALSAGAVAFLAKENLSDLREIIRDEMRRT